MKNVEILILEVKFWPVKFSIFWIFKYFKKIGDNLKITEFVTKVNFKYSHVRIIIIFTWFFDENFWKFERHVLQTRHIWHFRKYEFQGKWPSWVCKKILNRTQKLTKLILNAANKLINHWTWKLSPRVYQFFNQQLYPNMFTWKKWVGSVYYVL